MKAYLDLLTHILENGEEKDDRTNTGTISSFGHQLEFDLEEGFQLLQLSHLLGKVLCLNFYGFWRDLMMSAG